MAESLSMFKRFNNLNAKVMLKIKPAGWSMPTLLVRLHTQTGDEIMMLCTGEAMSLDQNLLEDRIYNFEIAGKSVKKNTNGIKNGIMGTFDIVCKFVPKFTLAETAWPTIIHYNLKSFINLVGVGADDWIDVMGRVQEIGPIEERIVQPKNGDTSKAYTLTSRTVTLRSGEFHEELDLVFPHTNLKLKMGDVLAIRGCKMKEYNMRRKITTAFMTMVEVNPAPSEKLGDFPKEESGTPSKKAMQGIATKPIPMSELFREMENFRNAFVSGQCDINAKREMTVLAKLEPFTDKFFEYGRPLYGNDTFPKMRIMAVLLGTTGRIPNTTIWDDAAKSIFKTDGNTIAGLWESCEGETGTDNFLAVLNAPTEKEFRFGINARLWKPEAKEKNEVKVQIHVQWAEEM